MSSKSNLDIARKYEWNSYIAKNSGNESDAIRYESMSKMALMDAASDKLREDKNNLDISSPTGHDFVSMKENPIASVVGIIIGIILVGGAYVLGMFL